MIKGLRGAHDLAYEASMATMNRHLTSLETVFLTADGRYTHLSSTLVKEVHSLGGEVSEFIPRAVQKRFKDGKHTGQSR